MGDEPRIHTLEVLEVSFGICGHDGYESVRRSTRHERVYGGRNAMSNDLTRLWTTILVSVTGKTVLTGERRRHRPRRPRRRGLRRRRRQGREDILLMLWKARGCVDGWGRGNRR